MKTIKKWVLCGAISGALLSCGSAFAQGPEGYKEARGPGASKYHSEMRHWGYGSEHRIKRMTRKLALTEEQQVQLETILNEAKEKSQPLHDKFRANMAAERDAMDSGVSAKKLKKLARETAESRVDLMLQGREVEGKVNGMLTEEQRQKLAELKAMRKAHMEQRHQKMQEKTGE